MAGFAVWGFVAGAAVVGALCSLTAVVGFLILAFRKIDQLDRQRADAIARADKLEGLVDQLVANTKAIDPVRSALDDEGDFQVCLIAAKDLIDYVGRKSPGAQKKLFEEVAPHLMNGRRRVK